MTEKLVDLPDVAQLSPRIVRILGGNPGKFTLQGTNTYLISSPDSSTTSSLPCVLIDTGEGVEGYTALLKKVVQGEDKRAGPSKRHITDIILTHRHHDHVGGLPSVLNLLSQLHQSPPRLHKYPDPETDEGLRSRIIDCKFEGSGGSSGPIAPLKDGSEFSVGDGGKTTLEVVHTPGHTKDHICLLLREEHALLTGDHVLGQGTSVFEDLGSYLHSLQKCVDALKKDSSDEEQRLYPAHGPTIDTGKKALHDYLSHRLERENQVLELLATTPAEEHGWTIKSIVSRLYSNYPEHLYPAAARGIFLHLRKLALPDDEAIKRGVVGTERQGRRVNCLGPVAGPNGMAPETPSSDAEWLQVMELQWQLLDRREGMDVDQKGSL